MSIADLISVEVAFGLIRGAVEPLDAESAPLDQAAGRTLSEDVIARATQPPFAASAMDGYAVRFEDCTPQGARFRIIAESIAGARFHGVLAAGEAVRIFTGATVPQGADHIVIQEEAVRDGDVITLRTRQPTPRHIRPAGADFAEGAILASAGEIMTGPKLALIAAGNHDRVSVARAPRIAVIANGDELAAPGAALGEDQIVSSVPYGLLPMIRAWGGAPEFLGVARDSASDISRFIESARDFDLIVPVGGASVGDRDLMRASFRAAGYAPIFEKVSVQPGKPTWFGRLGPSTFVLGLPGNPASAFVTARLFVRLAVDRFLGRPGIHQFMPARLATAVPAAGARETFLRARLSRDADARFLATPFDNQDSSLASVVAASDILVRRYGNAPALDAGAIVECLEF
jgi:molybdopterin molybdotransferase